MMIFKRGAGLCLVLVLLLTGSACAVEDMDAASQMDYTVDEAGYLVYTLPDQTIEPGKTYDQYMMDWEPIPSVHSYQLLVYRTVQSSDGFEYPELSQGWLGMNQIVDGSSKTHAVPFAPNEGMILSGDATEVDIAAMLNKLGSAPVGGATLHGYYCLVMIVPESGKPITQLVALP